MRAYPDEPQMDLDLDVRLRNLRQSIDGRTFEFITSSELDITGGDADT